MNNATKYIVNGFKYKSGVHCTSSSLRNIFEFHGLNLSEAMIFGLGSGMGLAFIKTKGMETIGGRSNDFDKNLCRNLDVQMNIFKTNNEEEGWERLKQWLDKKIPVAINIDMAFLKYRNLPPDYHFGLHTVVVCGYNPESETVFIGDTQYPEIQEISIKDLTRGRNYKYNRWMDPNNWIYELTFPDEFPGLESTIPKTIRNTGKNILSKSRFLKLFGVYLGVNGIDKLINYLQSWNKISLNQLKRRSMKIVGYISEYGTGGGLFRYLYSDFLNESASILSDSSLKNLSSFYRSLGDKWEEVARKVLKLVNYNSLETLNSSLETICSLLSEIKELEYQGAQKLYNYTVG